MLGTVGSHLHRDLFVYRSPIGVLKPGAVYQRVGGVDGWIVGAGGWWSAYCCWSWLLRFGGMVVALALVGSFVRDVLGDGYSLPSSSVSAEKLLSLLR